MSKFEYNNLLFQVSQRLDNINAGKQLLVICRGMLAARNEESIPTFLLFEELEEGGFLSFDRLMVLKAILEGVEEWSLLEKVEKFACKRKEYNNLLEQIIRVLDELNDLERLISICRGNITEGRRASIHDVRSLFKELESNDCLGIDCLEIVKEILTQTGKTDLLKEVEEFEQRQSRERRKAIAAAMGSSPFNKLVGVFTIKTVFRGIGGSILAFSAFKLLRRGSTYDQLVTAISTCILPVGIKLIQMAEGSVNLKVQAENRLALDSVWRMYKNGTLKARLEALFVTDEMRELAGGEGVEVIVTIDEREYQNARDELTTEARDDSTDKEEKRLKYLDQEKYDYIQNYLEQAGEQTKDVDRQSVTTETASDSGISGSNNTSSEVGTEDISDPISNLCLKDLSKVATAELACRLQVDPTALQLFYQAFGLDPEKLPPFMLHDIAVFLPYTPVKLLKDVFQELQLYDLVEMLEQVKSRSLRLSLPLKDMKKLLNVSDRPSKFYNKAEVLIVEHSDRNAVVDAYPDVERIGCFFQALNSQSQITKLTLDVAGQKENELVLLTARKAREDYCDWTAKAREAMIKELLESREGVVYSNVVDHLRSIDFSLAQEISSELRALNHEERPAIKTRLEKVIEEREQRKMKIEEIVEEIQQKKEEIKRLHRGEREKFQTAVSTVMDKWIRQAKDEDKESTLFVVLQLMNFTGESYGLEKFAKTTREFVKEKLALIPTTKLIIEDPLGRDTISIPQETLAVRLSRTKLDLAIIQELLNKRWMTLDLLSVLKEAQRTLPIKVFSEREFCDVQYSVNQTFAIQENLSYLPRLQKDEQKQESKDL